MMITRQVSTVGEMRQALKGWPSGTPLLNQAVMTDGAVWYCLMSVGELAGAVPAKLVVSLRVPVPQGEAK